MAVVSMNHFTVLARNLAQTRSFYIELLGLTEGHRPSLGFPGAWLYAGEQAVLHIIAERPLPEEPGGVLDHMAFSAEDLRDTISKLEESGTEFTLRRQAESNIWQMFFFDPNGARVELNFAPEETR